MDSNCYDTYCPRCDAPVCAQLEERRESLPINGEEVFFQATVAVCPRCGEVIGDSRIDQRNFERADEAYRHLHGIPTRQQIKSIRARYGMSLREFSRYLGFGEQTYASYERSAIPDTLHSRMIRLASTPEGARCLIPLAEGSISRKSLRLAQAFAHEGDPASPADSETPDPRTQRS